jgi:hypothetical protein
LRTTRHSCSNSTKDSRLSIHETGQKLLDCHWSKNNCWSGFAQLGDCLYRSWSYIYVGPPPSTTYYKLIELVRLVWVCGVDRRLEISGSNIQSMTVIEEMLVLVVWWLLSWWICWFLCAAGRITPTVTGVYKITPAEILRTPNRVLQLYRHMTAYDKVPWRITRLDPLENIPTHPYHLLTGDFLTHPLYQFIHPNLGSWTRSKVVHLNQQEERSWGNVEAAGQ